MDGVGRYQKDTACGQLVGNAVAVHRIIAVDHEDHFDLLVHMGRVIVPVQGSQLNIFVQFVGSDFHADHLLVQNGYLCGKNAYELARNFPGKMVC